MEKGTIFYKKLKEAGVPISVIARDCRMDRMLMKYWIEKAEPGADFWRMVEATLRSRSKMLEGMADEVLAKLLSAQGSSSE